MAQLATISQALQRQSTIELMRRALQDGRALAQLEVAIARSEFKDDPRAALTGAVSIAVGLAFLVVTLAVLASALVLALGGGVTAALSVAGGALGLGVVALAVGAWCLPREPLQHRRRHLSEDVHQLEEHLR
jgi:hypothetical protein